MKTNTGKILLWTAVISSLWMTGCRDHYPHSFAIAGGQIERSHGKPMEGGYYTDWDPFAGSIEITPVHDVNPTCTQHVLIVTVRDKQGQPLPSRRVEWMIPDGSVGTFVEVDESGANASRGHKIDNTYAVTHTNLGDHTLTRGNDDPSDDIHLRRGQTWATITSPMEGVTHVIAYAPCIFDWKKHKAFARKYWIDAKFDLSPPAINPIGTTHTFVSRVSRADGSPIPNAAVTFKIVSGPQAKFANGQALQTVQTGADGQAAVVISQVTPVAGVNQVQATVRIPAPGFAKGAGQILLGTALTAKTWQAPGIAITKSAPPTALKGQTFGYDIVVASTGRIPAEDVVVVDTLPAGIQYVSSSPEATVSGQSLTWNLGTLGVSKRVPLRVQVRGDQTGRFVNAVTVTARHGLKDTATAPTVINEARLEITKTGPATVESICGPIEYTVVVSNTGTAPATNVSLVDTLPAGMTCNGKSVLTVPLGTLAPGTAKSVRIPAQVKTPGSYVNQSVATADGGLSVSAQATTQVLQPKLTVTKTGPATCYLNGTVSYQISVKNVGDGPSYQTTAVDTLPNGFQLISASQGATAVGNRITWKPVTLKPGEAIDLSVTAKALTKGTFKNQVRVTGKCCAEGQAEVTTVVKGISALLLECKDNVDPVRVGTDTTYVITVTNQGSAIAANVVISCTIPPEQTLISANGAAQQAGTKTLTFTPVVQLGVGQQLVYTLVTRGAQPGDSRFRVSMTSDDLKTPVEETESTNIYRNE